MLSLPYLAREFPTASHARLTIEVSKKLHFLMSSSNAKTLIGVEETKIWE